MEFPRQVYWSGLPLPTPGDLPDPGIEPMPPALGGGFFTSEPPGKPHSQWFEVIASHLSNSCGGGKFCLQREPS